MCLFIGIFLGYQTRNEWFEVDEWEFLTTRVGPQPPRGLLIPHNEHPSMIPILIWRGLFDVFGIVHYWPYMVVLIVFHLVVTVEVWWVARRCGAGPGACLVAAAVMASVGYGGDNMVWAFQIGMVGSLAASWAGTLLLDAPTADPSPRRPSWRRLAGVWSILVAGLCCSAVSVPLLVLPLLVGGARWGWRTGLRAVSVPLLLFLGWYAVWGRTGPTASKGFQPFQLAGYTIDGLATTLDGVSGVSGAAAVAGVLVLVAARRGWLGTRSTVMESAGVVGAVGLFAFISVGRSSLGLIEAESSRYAYLVTGLILPASAIALQRLLDSVLVRGGREDHRRLAVTWVALIVAAVGLFDRGLGQLETRIALRVPLQNVIRAEAAAGDALVASGAPLLATATTNHYSGYLNGAGLIRLHRLHALSGLPRANKVVAAEVQMRFQTTLAAREPASVFTTGPIPPTPATIREFLPTRSSVDALTTTPRPLTTAPRILDGYRAGPPPGLPRSLRCVTAAPAPGERVVVTLNTSPRYAVAEYLLASIPTTLTYSWAPNRRLHVSADALLEPVTVYQLTSLSRTGTLQLSSSQTFTVCPVP